MEFKKKKKKNHAHPGVRTLKHLVRNNSRTEWSPIRSLIIRVRNKIIRPQKGESDLLITTMITDRIGRHDVRSPINQNYEKIWEEEKISNHPFLQKKNRKLQLTRRKMRQQRAHMTCHTNAYCAITLAPLQAWCIHCLLVLKSGFLVLSAQIWQM